MVGDSNTNSKSNSSGADRNSSSSTSSGGNTNSKSSSSSGASRNTGGSVGGGSVGGGMSSSTSGGNTNSKSNSGGADRNSSGVGGGSSFGGSNSPAGVNRSSVGSSSVGGGTGLNSAGNRATGAGPGASANRTTVGTVGSTVGGGSPSIGGMNSPRGMANSSLGSVGTNSTSPAFGGQNSPGGMLNASLGGMAAAAQDKTRQGDLAQQARASETKSMNDMTDWGKEVKSVADAGAGWTTVTLNNGLTETRKGDRASRNNNPGNIEAGAWATKAGAIGTDGRFAVFPSKEDGFKAIGSLLGTAAYTSKTVEGAIGLYAPKNENNTAAYAAAVAGKIGVSKDTPMSSLTAAQRTSMARAITGVEGNTGYSVTSTEGTNRFASTYMGGQAASPASTASPSAGKSAATSQQQNDPSGLPAGTYRGYDPSGLPPDTPAKAPAPGARPDPVAAVSGPAPATQPTGQFPDRPRSLGEKIAAGVIDAGGGMLPGIGMGVSLVNGALALTGNATLGERVVDSFMTGKNAGTPADSSARSASGNGGNGQVVKNTSTVPKETESFESRYLAFVDPTPRPTPAQRWDYTTPGYV